MDLIDRERLVKWLRDVGDYLKILEDTKIDRKLIGKIIDHIEKMPTVEAGSVRHGKWWMNREERTGGCSECKFVTDVFNTGLWNYCPNCGSKMDGD